MNKFPPYAMNALFCAIIVLRLTKNLSVLETKRSWRIASMNELLITKLEDMVDKETDSTILHNIDTIFLSAISDWPTNVLTVEDYLKRIKYSIVDKLTKDHIERALSTVDVLSHAWETESLSQIIEVFQFYKEGITLDEIVENIKAEI